jgi:hypothetical protein
LFLSISVFLKCNLWADFKLVLGYLKWRVYWELQYTIIWVTVTRKHVWKGTQSTVKALRTFRWNGWLFFYQLSTKHYLKYRGLTASNEMERWIIRKLRKDFEVGGLGSLEGIISNSSRKTTDKHKAYQSVTWQTFERVPSEYKSPT